MIPIHSWNKRAHFKDETGITSITIINAPNQQVPYNIKKKIKNRSPKNRMMLYAENDINALMKQALRICGKMQ